jgi:hypothetical protein
MNTITAKPITLEDLPADMIAQVRKALVVKHTPGMSMFGAQYLPRMNVDKLNLTEKVLVSFYAFEQAVAREDYRMLPELAGFVLYGLVSSDATEAAEKFLTKMTDPEQGSTFSIVVSLWVNLRHLYNEYNTDAVIPEAAKKAEWVMKLKGILTKSLEDNLEGLWAMSRIQENRTNKIKLGLYVNIGMGIAVAVALVVWLTKLL